MVFIIIQAPTVALIAPGSPPRKGQPSRARRPGAPHAALRGLSRDLTGLQGSSTYTLSKGLLSRGYGAIYGLDSIGNVLGVFRIVTCGLRPQLADSLGLKGLRTCML